MCDVWKSLELLSLDLLQYRETVWILPGDDDDVGDEDNNMWSSLAFMRDIFIYESTF